MEEIMEETIKKPEQPEMIKTYGVFGLMEWVLQLPTGYAALPFIQIKFEGGHISGYGVTPARLTTSDPLLQRLIEASPWFRPRDDNGKITHGRIRLLKSVKREKS